MKPILAAMLGLILSSCAGYHLGGTKPPSLSGVKSISVPMLKNGTLHPRSEALATSAMTDALVQDGTYRISDGGSADAIFEGKLVDIGYSTLRSSRIDTLRAEELTNTVRIDWILRDAKDPTRILASGKNEGTSSFFVDSNLQTARHNALPDALERACRAIVSTLSTGY